MLALSLLFVIVPLVGIGLIFYQEPAITVDNLFISLMLLTISGVFLLNVMAEMKRKLARKKSAPAQREASASAKSQPARSVGAAAAKESQAIAAGKQRGIVRDVQFFESAVGVPNKSIVSLQLNGANSSRVFTFEGDLRNALPVGKKVEISYRETADALDLQDVNFV